MSLCWSGEIRVLRKHSHGSQPCPGSGRPAVGELPSLPRPVDVAALVQQPSRPVSATEEQHVASVA